MNSKLTNVLMLVIGATIGSVTTFKLIDRKYEMRIQEEIASVKKSFANRSVKVVEKPDIIEDPEEKKIAGKIAADISSQQGYVNYSTYSKDESEEEIDEEPDDEESIMAERPGDMDQPYVIPPEEFGEIQGYERISLSYFADGILADENDEEIDDVDYIVGTDSLTHFGEYEDDSVFVRNDKLKCDYEILKDNRRWVDIVDPPTPKIRKEPAKKPHQMEE